MPTDLNPRHSHPRPPFFTAYSFALVTGALFVLSWIGQFVFQAIQVSNDAATHGETFEWAQFWPEFLSATLENWQSEFLQLVWQAAGLAMFYFWGSSQSREGADRVEAKIDRLLTERGIDPQQFEIAEEHQATRQAGHTG
ncbi:DUF6766 family protein [Georgenia alba]|uniref:DUF6766 family protein n=1 Tax=Georgenia alba TaxID=2233858 RepID=A0ABW2Q8G1_9MICO